MANYTPTPSYGARFTSNAASQPAPSSSFPPHDGAYNPYVSHPVTTPQHALDAFWYNATLPGVDLQALGVNAAQISSLITQIQSGALPPPPFPLPPAQQNGIPPPPPPFPATAASPYHPPAAPSYRQVPAVPFVQLDSAFQTGQENSHTRTGGLNSRIEEIVITDREEGELSDIGTVSVPHDSKSAETPEKARSGASSQGHRRVPSRSNAHGPYRPTMNGTKRGSLHLESRPESPRSVPRRDDSLRSHYNRSPLASPVASPGEGASHRGHKAETIREPAPDPPPTPSAAYISAPSDRAKVLISLLHNHHGGYAELVHYGLDANILSKVYKDLGLPLPHTAQRGPLNLSNEMTTSTAAPKAPNPTNNGSVRPQQLGATASSDPRAAAIDESSQPSSSTKGQMPTHLPTPSKETLSQAKTPPAISTASTSKQPVATRKTGNDLAAREAYQARLRALQAARSNKPAPTPEPVAQSSVAASSVTAPANSMAAPEGAGSVPLEAPVPVQAAQSQSLHARTGNNIAAAPETVQLLDPQPVGHAIGETAQPRAQQSSAAGYDAVAAEKRKAQQTELARQKMEALAALKRSNANVAQKQVQEAAAQDSSLPHPQKIFSASIAEPARAETIQSPVFNHTQTLTAAPPNSNQNATFGGIPGLFMAAGAPASALIPTQATALAATPMAAPPEPNNSLTHATPSKAPVDVPISRGKKRPVAADFDDLDSAPVLNASKRPFVQGRFDSPEAMIIEVSDDEGSDMELDEAEDAAQISSVSTNTGATPVTAKQAAIRDLPLLTDFPRRGYQSKQGTTGSTSAVNTPSATQTPSSPSVLAEAVRKEAEVLALRKKIAELEQKRLAKLSQISRAQTPMTPNQTTKQLVSSQTVPVTKPDAPPLNQDTQEVRGSITDTALDTAVDVETEEGQTQKELPVAAPSGQLPVSKKQQPRVILTTEVMRPAPMVSEELERKRCRHAEIQSGLPALEASVANNKARLEQLKKEMEELEAENQRRLQDKENLIRELESLGVDTEGMPHEELQAKKDEIVQQREDEAEAAAADQAEGKSLSPEVNIAQTAGRTLDNSFNNGQPIPDNIATRAPEVPATASPSLSEQPEADGTHSDGVVTSGLESVSDAMEMSDTGSEEGEINDLPEPHSLTSNSHESAQESSAASDVQDVPIRISDSSRHKRSQNSDAPVEEQELKKHLTEQPVTYMNTDVPAQQKKYQGELADQDSSPSGSEDYESPDVAEYEQPGSDPMDVSDDDYEPTDVAPPLPPTEVAASAEPSFSSVVQERNSPARHDIPAVRIADDLAPELQPEPQIQQLVVNTAMPKPVSAAQTHFKPYESPLKMFKAYRYHPQYSHEVSGGFRSMTYSHTIDQEKPLCPFEAVGGTCNDVACDFQHFRSMGLSDDMILVQLGTTNPGRTDEEKSRWAEGLKAVLKELRQKNVRDPNVVAMEIANYRRSFLKDPTKVLNI